MKLLLQTSLLLILSVSALVATGCVGPRNQPKSAVFCPSCKVVWVEMLDFDDPYRMSTSPGRVMECPDCERAAVGFFETGKLEHSCKACGGELVHCERR